MVKVALFTLLFIVFIGLPPVFTVYKDGIDSGAFLYTGIESLLVGLALFITAFILRDI